MREIIVVSRYQQGSSGDKLAMENVGRSCSGGRWRRGSCGSRPTKTSCFAGWVGNNRQRASLAKRPE